MATKLAQLWAPVPPCWASPGHAQQRHSRAAPHRRGVGIGCGRAGDFTAALEGRGGVAERVLLARRHADYACGPLPSPLSPPIVVLSC